MQNKFNKKGGCECFLWILLMFVGVFFYHVVSMYWAICLRMGP